MQLKYGVQRPRGPHPWLSGAAANQEATVCKIIRGVNSGMSRWDQKELAPTGHVWAIVARGILD